MYQAFRPVDGVMTSWYGPTKRLETAIKRAARFKGEVRIWGTLTVVWLPQVLTSGQVLTPKPKPKALPKPVLLRKPQTALVQVSSVQRYHPKR